MDVERMPRLYVEVDAGECVVGRKTARDCVVIQENVEVWLKEGGELPGCVGREKAELLAREIYDRFHLYVDREEGRVLTDAILILPDGRTRIYLKRGDELMILPVEGYTKTIIANVGNRVRRGDAFAAVTTRKGEVHYLKPPRTGTVVFIDEMTDRPHYVYYLLPEE